MAEKKFETCNDVVVMGVVEEELEFSHETEYEKFYRTRLRVTRLSGVDDMVPILVSERLLGCALQTSLKGRWLKVQGELRSYNLYSSKDARTHLDVVVFVECICVYRKGIEFEDMNDVNNVCLSGIICKQPVYRETPFGRQITDLLLAVNRNYNKSSYIPCIVWGRNAVYAKNLNVGDEIRVYGRFQSREYTKKVLENPENFESRITYEVSVAMINVKE